jgi:UDP-GlcNAc:undecaprenyl-phosphate/decaprenyl-phosphate GlcNAc-1-phosphate transferase
MILSSSIIFLITFLLVCYSIKKIIYISYKKHLFDEPTEIRKIHETKTPNLGGVAIVASMIAISCLFLSTAGILHLNYIIIAAFGLFILGLTDDLVGVNPSKKIMAQLGVAVTIVILADCRLTNFHGVAGIYEIPYWAGSLVSVAFIIFFINAFNLIDGIDCLAGGIGFLICSVFAFYFYNMNQPGWYYVAVAMCGCLLGFLFFNRSPAKIFMGDTGSMFLGLIVSILSINFIELNKPVSGALSQPVFKCAPALVYALLIIPFFDTIRIFSIRIINKKSPFAADRKHIHHRLLDLRFSHMQSTGMLLMANVVSIVLVAIFITIKTELLLLLDTVYILLLNGLLFFIHYKRDRILLNQIKRLTPPKQRPKSIFFQNDGNTVMK